VTIVLTDAGREAVVEGYRRQHQVERAWLASLSDTKRAQLTAALRVMLEHRPVFDAPASPDGAGEGDA
jgi:hypothetical protein